MAAIVLVEHDQKNVKPSTLSAVTAALKFSQDVDLLVLGHGCDAVVQEASKISGVRSVKVMEDPLLENPLAETFATCILSMMKEYQGLFAPATTTGKNVLPRVAALLGVGQLSDIMDVLSENTFVRGIYAGNAIATVETSDPIKVCTVRTTAFDKAGTSGSAGTEKVAMPTCTKLSEFVKLEGSTSARPELTAARVVISGGRGLQSRENFQLIENLADQLNGAIGASRAAVDAGYVPNDYQVGQTGKVVAPELYIAVGISGAIQHLAGMKDSKVIVAINKDEDAPIFQVADYGLVGDLFEIIPELTKAVTK